MKTILFILIVLMISSSSRSQTQNPQLDSVLAKKLGGDEYGMKSYVLVILKTGANTTKDKAFIDSCFLGHLNNIKRLAALNQLVVSGPFGKNDNSFRGLFILNVKTREEANLLLATDPAIKAELLKPELYPWYGSAALPEYLPAHDKIWKTGF
ncbi:MAG: hypothetical protein IPP93_12250 [Chitinophagaceae bacterium]|nr:hypothetical protein [Chitinophagaceae bacterium]MBL0336846.1 hypothetical protein [Chitinophagaceae bacterium]